MMMNQNSSDYLGNDSAELQLSKEIQNIVAPDVKGPVEVKFDGYGTLHILERNDDGGLVSDSYFAKNEDDFISNVRMYTNADKLAQLEKTNMWLRVAVKIEKAAVGIFIVLFILFCLLLKMTLQRYM